jgi:hypothetical protein
MLTPAFIIIAAISGLVSTLAGIFTRRVYKRVTHLETQVGQSPPPEVPENRDL